MPTAADLRAEAARVRAFALTVTDALTLEALQEMVDELEVRAEELDGENGAQ